MGLTEEELQALISYRFAKSREVFKEACDVASLGHWNLTVNRLYYSLFHACGALLLANGCAARSHNGQMRMVMRDFVQPGHLSKEDGHLLASLFSMRQTGDYDDLYDWDESQVRPLSAPVENLLAKINAIYDELFSLKS